MTVQGEMEKLLLFGKKKKTLQDLGLPLDPNIYYYDLTILSKDNTCDHTNT